jgi:hypothetical protein
MGIYGSLLGNRDKSAMFFSALVDQAAGGKTDLTQQQLVEGLKKEILAHKISFPGKTPEALASQISKYVVPAEGGKADLVKTAGFLYDFSNTYGGYEYQEAGQEKVSVKADPNARSFKKETEEQNKIVQQTVNDKAPVPIPTPEPEKRPKPTAADGYEAMRAFSSLLHRMDGSGAFGKLLEMILGVSVGNMMKTATPGTMLHELKEFERTHRGFYEQSENLTEAQVVADIEKLFKEMEEMDMIMPGDRTQAIKNVVHNAFERADKMGLDKNLIMGDLSYGIKNIAAGADPNNMPTGGYKVPAGLIRGEPIYTNFNPLTHGDRLNSGNITMFSLNKENKNDIQQLNNDPAKTVDLAKALGLNTKGEEPTVGSLSEAGYKVTPIYLTTDAKDRPAYFLISKGEGQHERGILLSPQSFNVEKIDKNHITSMNAGPPQPDDVTKISKPQGQVISMTPQAYGMAG